MIKADKLIMNRNILRHPSVSTEFVEAWAGRFRIVAYPKIVLGAFFEQYVIRAKGYVLTSLRLQRHNRIKNCAVIVMDPLRFGILRVQCARYSGQQKRKNPAL